MTATTSDAEPRTADSILGVLAKPTLKAKAAHSHPADKMRPATSAVDPLAAEINGARIPSRIPTVNATEVATARDRKVNTIFDNPFRSAKLTVAASLALHLHRATYSQMYSQNNCEISPILSIPCYFALNLRHPKPTEAPASA